MKHLFFICSVCVILLVACKSGDKYADIFAKHQPRITELRNFLSGLTTSLNEAGRAIVPVENLNPALNLGNYDTTGNTLILQYHLLASPENFTSYDSLFGLYYNLLAADAFKWTGTTKERMILEQDYLSEEQVENKIASLSTDRFPYLLIVKATDFEPLKQNGEGVFEGGAALASFYLYDWRSKKQMSAISLTAKPDAEMLYAYQSKDGGGGKIEAANKKAKETMEKNMRTQVYSWLKEITGGAAIVPAY